jgi:hypothetical protein
VLAQAKRETVSVPCLLGQCRDMDHLLPGLAAAGGALVQDPVYTFPRKTAPSQRYRGPTCKSVLLTIANGAL